MSERIVLAPGVTIERDADPGTPQPDALSVDSQLAFWLSRAQSDALIAALRPVGDVEPPRFTATQKEEPFPHCVNIQGGDRGTVWVNLGTPAAALAFVLQVNRTSASPQLVDIPECLHCGSDSGDETCEACLVGYALEYAHLPPDAAKYVWASLASAGFTRLHAGFERCLIAAETRDLDHLADLEAANIDPQSRRLREIIARRRSELHLLLTAPPVEGFSPVWGKS